MFTLTWVILACFEHNSKLNYAEKHLQLNWILTEKYISTKVKRLTSVTVDVLEPPLPQIKFRLVSIVCIGMEDD